MRHPSRPPSLPSAEPTRRLFLATVRLERGAAGFPSRDLRTGFSRAASGSAPGKRGERFCLRPRWPAIASHPSRAARSPGSDDLPGHVGRPGALPTDRRRAGCLPPARGRRAAALALPPDQCPARLTPRARHQSGAAAQRDRRRRLGRAQRWRQLGHDARRSSSSTACRSTSGSIRSSAPASIRSPWDPSGSFQAICPRSLDCARAASSKCVRGPDRSVPGRPSSRSAWGANERTRSPVSCKRLSVETPAWR